MNMADDLFDEFMEYDLTMGSDVVTCPHCGADVPCSLFFDDEVDCPGCGPARPSSEGGKKFKKGE